MSAQIEPNPRQGVELSERWPWLERAAVTAAFALLGVLAWALLSLSWVPCVLLVLMVLVFFVAADFIETQAQDWADSNPPHRHEDRP